MNELKIFNNPEFGEIRTLDINGEPWMVGKDVAAALGYSNTADAVQKHVDDEDKLESQIAISGQNRKIILINESGLYSLVLSSKLPGAKKFRRWVTSEVLPSIRQTGGYTSRKTTHQRSERLQMRKRNALHWKLKTKSSGSRLPISSPSASMWMRSCQVPGRWLLRRSQQTTV